MNPQGLGKIKKGSVSKKSELCLMTRVYTSYRQNCANLSHKRYENGLDLFLVTHIEKVSAHDLT